MGSEMCIRDRCALGAVYVGGERALDPRAPVGANAHVRVHTRPRRYPAADATDWRRAVVHDGGSFVVLNKPRGVPTHATVDNVVETCQAQLGALLGVPLGCPHRLDVPTRGLLVLSKGSGPFLQAFSAALRERRVRKRYRALCAPSLADDAPPPPLGELRHWILPGEHEPTRLAPIGDGAPLAGWRECVSVVHAVRASRARFVDDAPSVGARRLVELELELCTGRTHQLRAQLAHIGWPIVGDDVYAASGKGAAEARAAAALAIARDPRLVDGAKGAALVGGGPEGPQAALDVLRLSTGFFGLVASELAFDDPLRAGVRHRFALLEADVWR